MCHILVLLSLGVRESAQAEPEKILNYKGEGVK
jgi:hypothetical protein